MTAVFETDIDSARLRREAKEAMDHVLRVAAFRATEIAQSNVRGNGQIDTGFMINAIYPIWSKGSGFEQARLEASAHTTSRDGSVVDHSGDMSPEEPLLSGASSAVVAGAVYSIYQEAQKPFLYPAAEQVSTELGVAIAMKIPGVQ